MKLKLNLVAAAFLMTAIFSVNSFAQAPGKSFVPNPIVYKIFDTDSLRGFDEEAARRSAISENFLGSEFKVRMYQLKRKYINDKYNLAPKASKTKGANTFNYAAKTTVVAGCVNEDFEASTAGVITTSNQIAGWTVMNGLNDPVATVTGTNAPYFPNGLTGANSCNGLGCCPLPPQECELITIPAGGYQDPEIGAVYPIFSVFGSSAGDPNAEATNTHVTQGMFGDNVIRINSNLNNYSMVKLSKTFSVSSSNALFQFAFISVFSTGHGCCDAGAFQIKLSNATTGQPITCPSFSASALSTACTNTNTGIQFLNTGTGSPASTSSSYIFNKWQLASMDLSAYLNQNITIDVITSDCTAGGHYGYVYFDAQCGPMAVIGNGVSYAAGTGSVNVPTCGASGATICASAGLGPYFWSGPNVPPSYATASYTNQCFITNISATYTLSMNPPGACAPITRVINSTITPAPALTSTITQAACGSTIATMTVIPGGSATNPSNLTWFPPPLTLNSQTTIGTFSIPPGPAPTIVTVTATDPIGCQVTTTANINPAPPIPSFSIQTTGASFSITCANPTVYLSASSSYNYNNNSLAYFWASPQATYNTNNIEVTTGGTVPITFTVNGYDPVTLCNINKTYTVGVNRVLPNAVVSPSFQNISCGTAPIMVTLTATNPTLNVTQTVYDPLGGSYVNNSYLLTYPPFAVGQFSCVTVDDVNGCSTITTFSVGSTVGFPTFSLSSSPPNFTLGCTTKSVSTINILGGTTTSLDINGNPVPNNGPVSYTIIGPPTTGIATGTAPLSGNSTPTVSVPGTWTVVVRDNSNGCDTRVPVSVLSRTLGPGVDSLLIPNRVLTCNTPSVLMRVVSNEPATTYNWAYDVIGNVSETTLVAVSNTAAPTSTVAETFSITLTNTVSTCKTTTVFPILQNLFPPKAKISGLNELSCKTKVITLTNDSQHGLPANAPFQEGAPIGFKWLGPTPQLPQDLATTYQAQTPGTYTLIVKDSNNGCLSQTVFPIANGFTYPQLDAAIERKPTVLDCGASNTIAPVLSQPIADLTYTWTAPSGAPTSNANASKLIVSQVGEYDLFVLNTKSGCSIHFDNLVIANNEITSDFTPDRLTGFAPLTVNFENNSRSAAGNSSVSSVWNFGNGTTSSFTSVASASAVYTQPGTYTVTLFTKKGSCLGSVKKTITVDIPSALTMPNVFTPNGDNINDLFFLKTTNLALINLTIYDRWGHKVYDLQTDKGNVAWDGKNLYGKEAPEGTYFYVLRAVGKDDKEYKDKGTINLFR